MKMNNNKKPRNSIHLYNPKSEGLGAYDIHYINAYRNNKTSKAFKEEKTISRYAS